jgi:hypothetical protein
MVGFFDNEKGREFPLRITRFTNCYITCISPGINFSLKMPRVNEQINSTKSCSMNDSTNPKAETKTGPDEARDNTGGSGYEQSNPGRGLFESLRSGLNAGAEQARKAAEEAAPKIKTAVSDATYWFGFGVSYAAVFSYVLAKDLAPGGMKAGFSDGAEAAKKKAEEFAENLKATPSGPSATGADQPANASQAG